VNDRHIDVVDLTVIKKVSAMPVSAFIAGTKKAEAIIDAAVEAHVRSPISSVPDINAVTPPPIAGRPKEARLWREHPCAGHPIVAVVTPSPIPGRPDITLAGAERLRVYE
jgi:hypothetical protein